MSKVVNLNRVRKARVRAQKRVHADENAVRFGRTKEQKRADADASDRAERHLEGHRKEPDTQ